MKTSFRLLIAAALYLILSISVLRANSDSTSQSAYYNIHSSLGIESDDILWRRTVWRHLDLREPRNEGFYARNQELSRIILNAALAGEIPIYSSDSLSYGNRLSINQLQSNLRIRYFESPYSEADIPYLEHDSTYFTEASEKELSFDASDIYSIEIKEEIIFDKERSQLRHDIISMRLILSGDHPLNLLGVDQTICTVSYQDLTRKIFSKQDIPKYYLTKNLAHPISLGDAIRLNYHFAPITKINNARDEYLAEQCDCSPEELLWKSLELEHNLLEFEHKLWKTF